MKSSNTEIHSFNQLDYGTKPTTTKLEQIYVTIDDEFMLGDFAKAYVAETYRRNPIKAEQINLTSDELKEYFSGLLAIRIESLNGNCKVWRQAKQLLIPTWIQFSLCQIGRVVDHVRGLEIIPKYNGTYDLDQLLNTSMRLGAFINDGMTMHKDAFPRDSEGDKDVMSMALIDGYINSMTDQSHPISSYVSAFLGMKLEEEAAFKILYRVRYDDAEFIRSMLMHEESII